MKRLYNEYGACPYWRDEVLKSFNDLVEDCSKKIVAYVKENDLDVRDSNSWTKDTLDTYFSEMILRRAMSMRREEKAEKRNKCTFCKELKENCKSEEDLCGWNGGCFYICPECNKKEKLIKE